MAENQLGDSDNTPRKAPEQEAGKNVLLRAWVDAETGAEITEGLRSWFRSENAAESIRLVLKGFVRISAMRDALDAEMGLALRGPAEER